MNELVNLLSICEATREAVTEAEDARDSFLEPILHTLGATGGGIASFYLDACGEAYVTRSGSCRGSRWTDDYTFPANIFTADDPQKAAKEYLVAKKQAKEDADRKEKQALVWRLQKELER